VLVGIVAYATPMLAAVASFLNPWRQKGQAAQAIRVASLAAVPLGGEPARFPVIADRTDAWNRYPAEPIGAVFLRRIGPRQVVAYQALCPHAGCLVGLDSQGGFFCPCHAARFGLDGKRSDKGSVSPRDLDTLEVDLRGEEIWVKFEKFQTGTPEKIART
jgi:Rieske Fe-S protein